MYFCSWKMTNLNVRFFSYFGKGAYLVDIKLIISQFLPIFILINIRTRVPFKIISTPNNQSITKLPNLQKRVFPQKDKKNITYETIYTSSIYIQFLLFIPRKEIIQHAQRKKTSQLTLWQQKSLRWKRSTGSFLLYYYIMYIRIRFSQAS